MRLLTIGTFDIPHMGHAAFLKQCESFADEVLVGVNTDEFVDSYKGERPVFGYDERCGLIRNLGYQVVHNNGAGRECIAQYRPSIIAIGSDWARKDYLKQIDVTQDWLDELGIMLLYIPYTKGISTTDIKKRLDGRDSNSDD